MQTDNRNVKIFYELQRIRTAWLPESRNYNKWTITPSDFFKNKVTNRYWKWTEKPRLLFDYLFVTWIACWTSYITILTPIVRTDCYKFISENLVTEKIINTFLSIERMTMQRVENMEDEDFSLKCCSICTVKFTVIQEMVSWLLFDKDSTEFHRLTQLSSRKSV